VYSYNIVGEPTNWGLNNERLEACERLEREERGVGDNEYATTYASSYIPKQLPGSGAPRFAVPRDQSSNLHKYNKLNNNLKLRGVSTVLPQMPELLAVKHPYSR